MFDEHLNRQHRLTYFARGPEWAFAIPQGDLGALEDVMRRCSTFWNGVGSLFVPIGADGRISPTIKALLGIRPVDACYMHEGLGEKARVTAQQFAAAIPLWDGFDQHEIHPLNLLGVEERPPEDVMEPPRFRSAALRRVALAAWGHVPDEDEPHWAERFTVVERDSADAHGALLRGQIEGQSVSPLRMTARYMDVVRQVNPVDRACLCIIGRPTFNALVDFWNFRARSLTHAHGAPVIGLPGEALKHPEQLEALTSWLFRHPSMRLTPDIRVACPPGLLDDTRAALATVPFVEDTGDRIGEAIGVGFTPNDPPTFLFTRATVGGSLMRGIASNALVAFARGRSSLALPSPESFKARTFSHTRLVFRNLPLPLPVTPSVAKTVHRDAQASDGVMVLTTAPEQWNFDIRLPTASEALAAWIPDHGFGFERSQDGHDADALLTRLGSLDALDVLADPKRVAVLEALTPRNRDKLAAALVSEARDEAGVKLDAETLAERLSSLGLFLEVETRTAGDIASTIGTGTRKRDVLEQLPALVEAGFVRRARGVRCGRCRFRMYLELSELDERVRCRACGEDVVLPVVDESGAKEPDVSYRLDGLMARIMDQDILPVLLTLRATRPPAGSSELFFAWPGVVVSKGERLKFDIDLVVSHGTNVDGTSNVWCIEVKKTAESIGDRQLRRLLDVAAELEARPGIAAMQGEFPEELARVVLEAGGQVLTAQQLFAGTAGGMTAFTPGVVMSSPVA